MNVHVRRVAARDRAERIRSFCAAVLAALFFGLFLGHASHAGAYNGWPAHSYTYINSTTSTAIKTGPGLLHTIVVGAIGTTWAITVSDGANTIATFTPTAIGELTFDLLFLNGLTITSTGTAGSITVTWE